MKIFHIAESAVELEYISILLIDIDLSHNDNRCSLIVFRCAYHFYIAAGRLQDFVVANALMLDFSDASV